MEAWILLKKEQDKSMDRDYLPPTISCLWLIVFVNGI